MYFRLAAVLLFTKFVLSARLPTPHTRSYFYVGGTYVDQADGAFMDAQMYVEHLRPAKVTHSLPLLFVHGLGQTATNWVNTPDGRSGWADFFLSKGYEVSPILSSAMVLS